MADNNVDLSIFDDEVPSVQPVEPANNKVDLSIFDDEVPTSAVLSEAARVNPDQQVKINQLSRDTGIPVDDVAVDPLGVEADHRAKKVASEDFTAHPHTGKFLSDFDKATIAHDDIGVLKKLETSLKVGAGVVVDAHLAAADKGVKAAKWFTQSFEGSGANFIRRMELAGRGLIQASSEGDGADYSKLLPEQIVMAKALGVEDTSSPEFIARTAKFNERVATLQKEISENTPRNLDIGQKMLRGGVESTMVSAPGLIASLATRSATPAIVSAGTFTFGDSYAEGRRSGLSHDDALLYGSVDSIIEMGTEYAPTKILGSVLDGGDLKKKILKYAATEVLGEQVATAGQTTNAVLNGIDEEWNNATTLEEKTKLQAERQLITLGSTVVAGSIQAGGVGGLRKTIDHFAKKRDEEISQFQVDQTTIDSIAVDANNSELRRRDTDSFHQFMSQADGDNNTHVFIDGVQAKLYLDTLEDKESPAVKLLAAGINDAAALGSDVVIPIADFATHIAGTEHFTALREFMNLNGTTPSPFRLKQSQDETETLMTDLMTRANENVSQYVESQQIFDTVKQQLIDTGRINSKNADVMARIVPAWATVFARDNGITVQQAYEQSGLVIQGPQTGEAARMGAELDALSQSFSTAMDSVKSLGEVVKEGKPDAVLGESVVLKFDNAQVQASIREDENNVYLTSIAAKKLDDLAEVATGTGRGTSVIDQLKKYADQTGKRLAVVDSTKSAKSYYEKISYLKQDDVTLDFDGEAYTPPISFTYTPATPSKFNQFVGVNAQGVPMAELDRAKHMREQGLGNNAIQRDTGWFMGVDGKWRYEISDHEAEWSVKPSQIPTYAEMLDDVSKDLFDKPFGRLPAKEENDQRQEVIDAVAVRSRQYDTVGGMLNHSALFKAYPSLRNVGLRFEKMNDDEGGYYDIKNNAININESMSESEQLSTLMHELQHSIQELEDFARGGAPSKPFADSVKSVLQRLDADMTNKLDTWDYANQWKFKTVDKAAELSRNALMYQSYKRLIEYSTRDKPSGVFRNILNESQWIYDDKFRGNREANDLQRKFYEIPRSGTKRQEAVRDIAYTIGVFLKSQIPESQITMFENDTRTMTGMINALSREASKAKELLKPRQELVGKAKRAALVAGVTKFKTPYDIYRALGGEIEARITQARLKLTPEQRRVRSIATDTDIPMSEAIVVMGGMELAVPEALSKSAPEKFNQSVYHGSPHRFDKFSLSAMGTGEGAQAFGWGMYFAGKKSVAEYYRDTLSKENKGNLYQVNIPDDNKLLDYDKPLSEQSEFVTTALEKQFSLSSFNQDFNSAGEFLKSRVRKYNDPQKASEELGKLGIHGLKFADAVSRNKPLNEIKKEFMDQLPEDAEITDVESLIGTGVFSDKNEDILKGLIKDDWLGFDYPAQAISAALGKNAVNYDISQELKIAIEKAQEGGTSNYVIWDENVVTIESVNDEQRKAEQFEQQSRGYYEPANSLIRLTEASNLSTFMHEFAHFMYEMELKSNGKKLSGIHNWFKRNAVDVAKEANEVIAKQTPDFTRSALVVTPSDVTLYLDNGTTGDAGIDNAIRVATHEQFARGWEAYIMEGKSPSIELRNVFRVMAQWMVEIYKSIRGLNVKLDDEMRKVLDTMIATEEQIKMAEARARFAPLFTDAAAAGMTEAEFAAYKERVEKAEGAATETLRDKLIAQITRTKKQEWKEEKQDLIDTELNALKALPVYRAIDTLRNGDFKLDHATVKELYGVEKTDARGITSTRIPSALNNMTAKGATGVHPDEAAAFFGYGSGAEMIDAITKAKPIGEAAAERAEVIMVERHGDILNDGSIEKEADDAVQNEERGRLILAELKVLSRGQRSIDREVIRGLAEETIGKLSYRQIHPNKYRNAEIKAAMEAASMFAKGNMEGAAAAKARQVMNYFLAMEATAAQNNITKIVDSMGRYNKKEVREEIMKAENGYWEQIVKILERFEFRKSATLSSVEQHNQDINTWANERMSLDGDGLVLSPVVLNELYKDHWKNVKYNDIQGVSDSVKNIEHVARYSNKMIRMGEEITFKKLVNKLVDHWSALPQRFHAQRTTVVDGKNYGRWIMGQMTKIPYLASWLDGGERIGLSHQVFVQPFNDAKHAEVALRKQIGNDVMKAIENRSKADKKRHNTKVFIPEIKNDENDGNLWGHQILAVALNTGNAGNLRKMLLGEGWANPENDAEITFNNPKLQAVLKHMTESDWKLVQLIWDRMDQLYPQLAEVHRRTTGLTPPKVEATPVVTPFGTFNGGYYPMKYDPNRSHKAELNEERLNANTESMFSTTGSIQSSVNASATNERTKYYAPVRLSLDVVPNHFQEVIHFITHHDAVREVNKLIRNKSIAESIKATMGPEEFAQLKPWLNDIAKDGSETKTKTFIEKAFGKLRMGTTLGVMGFKATTGILQVSGIFNTMGEAGAANTIHALRTILAGPDSIKSAWEFARVHSKTLSHRAESFDREMQNVMSTLQNKSGKLAMLQSVSMKHIAYIQLYMVDLPSWYAGYLKAMKEHGDEQRAYQYGDWVVEQAQGSGLTKDMAALFRNQGEVHRSLTMFMTYFSSLWNLERDIVKGAKSGKYNALDLAAKGLFFFTLPVLFEMLLRGKFGDDDDDEVIAQKLALQLALFPIQSVPFVRDLANASATDFGYTMSPVASILAKGIEGGSAISSDVWEGEDISARDIKNVTKLAGAAFGIPGTGQAWNSGEHLYNVLAEGEDLTFRELVIGPVKKQ